MLHGAELMSALVSRIAPSEATTGSVRTVLVVDDDSLLRKALTDALRARGFAALGAGSLAEAFAVFSANDVDVVALDEQLPDGRGHTLCARLVAARPGTKIVFMTAFPEFDHAVKAIRAGAYDYLSKPFELDAFMLSVRRCLDLLALESIELRERYRRERDAGEVDLVGDSPAFRQVRRLVSIAATADAPVLITGETGTGKSLIAKAIHFGGPRRDQAFVPVSCAALPDNLVEGELFGWDKGAFTGAVGSHEGAFEVADGGTLFLDEIGELPLHLQPKLLNVLEDRSVKRLGARLHKIIDARLVAATNAELERSIADRTFRSDLFYRLAVIHIQLPPLRERAEDIPALVTRLLRGICRTKEPPTVDDAELARLSSYAWPGNVRELRNVLERAVLLQPGGPLHPSELVVGRRSSKAPMAAPSARFPTLAETEDQHIAEALGRTGGNLAQAARLLDISLSTLKRRVRRSEDE
ncbi:MAG: sigma-54-dependent Fis family transcriptional regulator [Deltaproteobacteria bacterium]|nr:sigma-54-dependent Fis family transcriptional regulator [Deltaproteobacteria bacterium]